MKRLFLKFMELIYPLLKKIYPSDKVLKDMETLKKIKKGSGVNE